MRGRRIRTAAAALAALVLVTGAVGLVAGPPAGASGLDLPPANKAALAKMFRKELKPYGLRVSRGLLQNIETYDPDPNGTHLALYVSPRSSKYANGDYIKNFAKLTRIFVPMVFDRWDSLQSFDICQEPFDDAREAPPPVTQIFVSRNALDQVSWEQATLVDLLAAAPKDRRQRGADYYVYFNSDLREEPAFVAAAEAADYDTYRVFG